MAHAGDAELREKREKENALGPFFENLVDDVQSGATRQIYKLNYFWWWTPVQRTHCERLVISTLPGE